MVYGAIFVGCFICYIGGLIVGERMGIRDTEKRWSDAVERTKILTGQGYIDGPQTFDGP